VAIVAWGQGVFLNSTRLASSTPPGSSGNWRAATSKHRRTPSLTVREKHCLNNNGSVIESVLWALRVLHFSAGYRALRTNPTGTPMRS